MKKVGAYARHRVAVGSLIGLCLVTGSAPVADGDATEHGGTALPLLAETGRFASVLTHLKQVGSAVPGASTADLIKNLELYHTHHQQWQIERRDSYQFAFAEMRTLAEDDRLNDALAFAIEASNLADDAKAFLELPEVVELVAMATTRANQADEADDWLEAIDLYRRLDLLYDDPGSTYRDRFEYIAQHIRVIRIYNPIRLKHLYEQRAKEQGENVAPIHFGEDGWDKQLTGITRPMLTDALREAEQRHISDTGYNALLSGAIEALLILINTPDTADTFASLADDHVVTPFRRYLQKQQKYLAEMDGDLHQFEINDQIKRIFLLNRKTINLPQRVLVYEMTHGAIRILDDFSAMIWPYEIEQFHRTTKGKFYGVGIQISMSSAPPTVMNLDASSAAHKAGLREGDVIAEIDGRDVTGYRAKYVSWKLGHRRVSNLKLGIERADNKKELTEITLHHGVDVNVKRKSGRLTVKSPLRGTPAYKAGIIADDVIASVDGDDTTGWTLDQAVRRITGKLGTLVMLGIKRKGADQVIPVPITRGEIEIESVKGWKLRDDDTWDYYIDEKDRIGYVRLSQFIPQSSDELDAAINEMVEDRGLEALILDLRFNPGGLLNKAIDVANAFVDKGTIVSTVFSDFEENETHTARPHRAHRAFPVIVLINRTSASASEIVAGALQDHGRATIIGTRSYGKGSVQDPVQIPIGRGGALLKLTTQYYALPSKRIIHRTPTSKRWGVEPDLAVDMFDDQVRDALILRQQLDVLHSNENPADRKDEGGDGPTQILTNGLDPQLETALLVLKTRMVARHLELAHKAPPVATP